MVSAGATEEELYCLSPRSLYVHVPFCAHRCGYCDFTLIARRDDLIGDYLRALEREIAIARIPYGTSLDTVFFGGGTPTHPAPDEMKALFQIVRQQFSLSPAAEFSVEANPLDLTEEKIILLVEAGVNRVSLGVQSFSKRELELLERDHSPQNVDELMHRLRSRIQNISIDLIFGIPDQTLADWRATLLHAINLNPAHISTYGLTFEKGTAFWQRRERGDLVRIEEELEREQYALAMEELALAGYEQYEISNFAKPGFQCRHNNVYWSGDPYWAFGPGAARYLNGRRETNIRSVTGWLNRLERGESPVGDTETLDAQHRAHELVYLGLRRIAGVTRDEFQRRTGMELDDLYGETIRKQTELGTLDDDGSRICLTREGRFIADLVVMEFL